MLLFHVKLNFTKKYMIIIFIFLGSSSKWSGSHLLSMKVRKIKTNIWSSISNSASSPIKFSSVQFSRSVVSDSLWPHESQHARPPCPSPTPGVHPNSCPSNRWSHPAISSSVVPFSSWPQSLPETEFFSNESTLQMRWPEYWSFSFSISPSKEHPGLLQNGLVGSPCSPRDSQESSPTPQFKSINSSVLSLLYSPTLTSIHDHRKNHSLD